MAHKHIIRPWAILVWLLIWQTGASLFQYWGVQKGLQLSLLLPTPLEVFFCLGNLAVTAPFWQSIGWSSLRILCGFFMGCLLGIFLAVPASRWQWVRELLSPLMAIVKSTPVASFIILALVWISNQTLSLFISFLMVFPTVYVNVLTGILSTDRKLLEMAQVFRVPLGQQIRALYVPAVLPYFYSAVSLALGLCWKAGVAAEVIGLPNGSLGEQLYTAKVNFQTAELFAWTTVIVSVSVVFEKLFLVLTNKLIGKAGVQ